VTDTTTFKEKQYFVFEDRLYDLYYEPGRIYHTTHYYRKAENGDVMRFSERVDHEQLYYTFQQDSLNRPYLYCRDDGTDVKWQITFLGTGGGIDIPLHVFENCAKYFFDLWSDGHVAPLEVRGLAPHVGLIDVRGEGDRNFLVGAYINGVLIGDTTVTSVEEMPKSIMPLVPVLHPNYPNPFKNATQISYSIPAFWTEPVQVSIFDIGGREIVSFTNEELTKSNYEVQWNATDKSGKEVSSGIYIARLRSSKVSHVIKINFLR
jgi:hypothetical protein